MEDFTGKIVAVTGAASGLGRATAVAFARRGATLALIDKNEDGLNQLLVELGSYDSKEPYCLAADLCRCPRQPCLTLSSVVETLLMLPRQEPSEVRPISFPTPPQKRLLFI